MGSQASGDGFIPEDKSILSCLGVVAVLFFFPKACFGIFHAVRRAGSGGFHPCEEEKAVEEKEMRHKTTHLGVRVVMMGGEGGRGVGKAILGQKSSRNKNKKQKKPHVTFRGSMPASGAVSGMRGRWCLRRRGKRPRGNEHFWAFLQRQRGEGRLEEGQVSPAALSPPAWRGYAHQEQPLRRAPGAAEAHGARPGRGSSIFSPAPFCRPGAAGRGHFVELPPPPPLFVRQTPSFFVLISLSPPLTKRAALKTSGGCWSPQPQIKEIKSLFLQLACEGKVRRTGN